MSSRARQPDLVVYDWRDGAVDLYERADLGGHPKLASVSEFALLSAFDRAVTEDRIPGATLAQLCAGISRVRVDHPERPREHPLLEEARRRGALVPGINGYTAIVVDAAGMSWAVWLLCPGDHDWTEVCHLAVSRCCNIRNLEERTTPRASGPVGVGNSSRGRVVHHARSSWSPEGVADRGGVV